MLTADSWIKLARTKLPICQASPELQDKLRETIDSLQEMLQARQQVQAISRRGNIVLDTVLERICNGEDLHSSADETVALISSWCEHFGYSFPIVLPPKLLAAYGSQPLLDALDLKLDKTIRMLMMATPKNSDSLNATAALCSSFFHQFTLFMFGVLGSPSASSEEKAQWFLRLSKTSLVFSQGGGQLGGESLLECIWGACVETYIHTRGDSNGYGDSTGYQVMQKMMASSADEEAAAAVVMGAVILMEKSSTQPWDPELAGAVLAALQRIAIPPSFMDLPRVYISCLKSYGPRAAPALLTQLLSLPYTPVALKAKKAYPFLEATLAARSLAELEQSPASALELLHLSSSFGVGLDAEIYQRVMAGCIDTKQLDLAIAAMSSFFEASHLKAASVPSVSILRYLIGIPASQPSTYLQLCDADRLGTFSSELLRAGALEKSQHWALAAAQEAASRDISVPPEVVSALAEAFLPQPTQHQGPEAAADGGVESTAIAFRLMMEAQQQAPSEHMDAAVRSAATQRSPSGFGMQPPQPSALPRRAITAARKEARTKFDSARTPDRPKARKGGDVSWRSLSSHAKVRIAGLLLSGSDPTLRRYRPLALDMAPSQEVAALLLAYYQPRLGSEYPPGLLANVLMLAKGRGEWRGLGMPCLSALWQLPRDQQVSELAGGGAAALCQLLLRDAGSPTAPAAAGGHAGEETAPLDLLLGFLSELCCDGASSSTGNTASVGTLTYPDWHGLVLRLLALCEGKQGDRASPLIRQVVQILGIAATEAAGRDKRLAETVRIVQQVRHKLLGYADCPSERRTVTCLIPLPPLDRVLHAHSSHLRSMTPPHPHRL